MCVSVCCLVGSLVGWQCLLASYFKQKVINFKQLNTVARWLVNALTAGRTARAIRIATAVEISIDIAGFAYCVGPRCALV